MLTNQHFEIIDNSGPKAIQAFHVLGPFKQPKLGHIVLAVVKEAKGKSKLKKGDKCYALPLMLRARIVKKDGGRTRYKHRTAIILKQAHRTKEWLVRATRILDPASRLLIKTNVWKLASQAPYYL